MQIVRIIAALAILVLGLVVALSPRVVYAPQPRVILYFLMSVFVSILLGGEAVAELNLQLPGFVMVASGAAAVCFGMLYLLNHLSKPEEKIAVFSIVDENDQPLNIEWKGAVDVPIATGGLQATSLIAGSSLVLIFPEQVGETEVRVRKVSGDPQYVGSVSYAGTRRGRLRLGHELKQAQGGPPVNAEGGRAP